MPAARIAYVRHVGPYGMGNIEAMRRIKEWGRENGLMQGVGVIVGLSHDDPETTRSEHCRYDAGIVIPEGVLLDDQVSEGVLLPGRYAIYEIEHTAEAIGTAWGMIFLDLKRDGILVDMDRPALERYSEEKIERHLCEICVPVK
ncbi:AraC family transcriptional regulator [Bacillus mesophilum]|uniref:DNA gyrase inhibitor n=1 Tax=Bacillus mesophilum TaxID=1071718 RepID=A0A7V7RNK7_9BACI|nr:GyrI-like domain-containing protein [Bacillus mesophilum]KAB2334033.1 DNA gyrase inhibitor [Bacillus mesophilum]